MGAIVPDRNGDWYFFYWGEIVLLEKITDSNALLSRDAFNKYLVENSLNSSGNDYDETAYIRGDFSATYDYYKALVDNYDENYADGSRSVNKVIMNVNNAEYNLFTNNCTQNTMKGFYKGVLADGTTVKSYFTQYYCIAIIPVANQSHVQKIFFNSGFTAEDFDSKIQK